MWAIPVYHKLFSFGPEIQCFITPTCVSCTVNKMSWNYPRVKKGEKDWRSLITCNALCLPDLVLSAPASSALFSPQTASWASQAAALAKEEYSLKKFAFSGESDWSDSVWRAILASHKLSFILRHPRLCFSQMLFVHG